MVKIAGRGPAVGRLLWEQEVPGSIPGAPIPFLTIKKPSWKQTKVTPQTMESRSIIAFVNDEGQPLNTKIFQGDVMPSESVRLTSLAHCAG